MDNLNEVRRVLNKRYGTLFATLADSDTFVFKDAIELGNGYYCIQNDPFNLRNGDILKAFNSPEEILRVLNKIGFKEVSIGHSLNDFFGLKMSYYIVQASF